MVRLRFIFGDETMSEIGEGEVRKGSGAVWGERVAFTERRR